MLTYEERMAVEEANAKAREEKAYSEAERLLDDAKITVTGDRRDDYGAAHTSFSRIAAMWGAYLDTPIEARDVAAMMALLKVARLAAGIKRDSWLDLAGYAALGASIDEADRKGMATDTPRTGMIAKAEAWGEQPCSAPVR